MPSRDYEEFIAALNVHGVRYLVIGAHAVAFHARPRATKDLDILLDATAENARIFDHENHELGITLEERKELIAAFLTSPCLPISRQTLSLSLTIGLRRIFGPARFARWPHPLSLRVMQHWNRHA